MRRRRAFVLVMVLLICSLLLTMGLGYLGSRVGQYQSSMQSVQAAQARAVARAGFEDARAKLNRDAAFPPAPGVEQNTFSYTETLLDASGQPAGTYRVVIDSTYSAPPYSVLCLTCTGWAGAATHTYRAYLDVHPGSPGYFSVTRWDDLGAP